jgi:hypothetical protein
LQPRRAPILLLALVASAALAGVARAGPARCWIDKGALVAPAAFGDIAGDFLVDLAAPVSALHVTRAQEDGLEGAAATRDLMVAGRRLAGVTLPIADLDARTARFATTINGVIGADLLGRFIVEIDPSPCRLRLLGRRPGPWPGSVRLPLRQAGGRPVVPARITDGAKARDGLFALGTADWETRLAGARLARPQAAEGAAPVRLRALEVGGRLFEQVPAAVQPDGGDEARGAIGMAVLSHWRLRLDMARGWLELSPAELPLRSSPSRRKSRPAQEQRPGKDGSTAGRTGSR